MDGQLIVHPDRGSVCTGTAIEGEWRSDGENLEGGKWVRCLTCNNDGVLVEPGFEEAWLAKMGRDRHAAVINEGMPPEARGTGV